MTDKEHEYRLKVFDFMDNMQPGECCAVESTCKPENTDLFIACVKRWMDANDWQGWVSFNADYSKFYKTHPINFGKIKNMDAQATK